MEEQNNNKAQIPKVPKKISESGGVRVPSTTPTAGGVKVPKKSTSPVPAPKTLDKPKNKTTSAKSDIDKPKEKNLLSKAKNKLLAIKDKLLALTKGKKRKKERLEQDTLGTNIVLPTEPTVPEFKATQEDDKPQVKSFELEDIGSLENILARRKEEEEKRRRKTIYTILFMIGMVIFSAVLYFAIKSCEPKPLSINLVIEFSTSDIGLEPDPSSPGGEIEKKHLHPGDDLEIAISITNKPLNKETHVPLFLRFSVNINMDGEFHAFIFKPSFIEEDKWFVLKDDEGNQIDDMYYYGGYLMPNETLDILKSLKLKERLDASYQGKHFSIVIKIDVIDGYLEAVDDTPEWSLVYPLEWYDYMLGIV